MPVLTTTPPPFPQVLEELREARAIASRIVSEPGDCGRCVREQRVWKLQRDTSMIAASNVRGSSFDIEVEGGMLGSGNVTRDGLRRSTYIRV